MREVGAAGRSRRAARRGETRAAGAARLAAALLLVLLHASLVAAQARDELAGAWEQITERNLTTGAMIDLGDRPVRVLYVDGFYMQFTAAAGRDPRSGAAPFAERTREQLLEHFRGVQGQHGVYRIAGSTLVRTPLAAASPGNEGRETSAEFKVAGDVLTLVSVLPNGQKIERTFRRLRDAR